VPPLEANSTRRTPASRQASSSRSPPITLTSASNSGRSIETRTLAWAAWWLTTVTRSSAQEVAEPFLAHVALEQLDAGREVAPAAAREIVEHEHPMPAASASAARWLPMKPAPPVSRMVSAMRGF
jgi:hypothetical protein